MVTVLKSISVSWLIPIYNPVNFILNLRTSSLIYFEEIPEYLNPVTYQFLISELFDYIEDRLSSSSILGYI